MNIPSHTRQEIPYLVCSITLREFKQKDFKRLRSLQKTAYEQENLDIRRFSVLLCEHLQASYFFWKT